MDERGTFLSGGSRPPVSSLSKLMAAPRWRIHPEHHLCRSSHPPRLRRAATPEAFLTLPNQAARAAPCECPTRSRRSSAQGTRTEVSIGAIFHVCPEPRRQIASTKTALPLVGAGRGQEMPSDRIRLAADGPTAARIEATHILDLAVLVLR